MQLDSTQIADGREQPPDEIVDTTTGEVVDARDADALIALYERIDREYRERQGLRRLIAMAIARQTEEGESRTRRLRGATRLAKVEFPGDSWNQSILKEAWNAYPALRDEFLRIDSVAVKLREFKKLLGTTAPPDVETFKKMVAAANVGPTGTPSITVEK